MRHHLGSPQRRLFSLSLSLFACLILQATTANAQDTVTGAFEGTVTNSQTGAPIAGASVQFINQLSEVPIAKRSDAQGRFYQGLLPPGTYTIRVSAPGFKTREVEQRLLATRPNQVVPVPVLLDPDTPGATPTASPSPGATPSPQTTTPSAATGAGDDSGGIAADINTTDARRGGAFTREEVSTLPLGATTLTRTFDELALLLPGVADPPQTLGVAAGPGVGSGVGSAGQFSVNGLRSRANNFTVDGSDNNDEDIGVRRQGFLSLIPQPIESIEEYQVITLLAPAQFGRNIGAQVNAISKSGGNQFHGTFYGFFNPGELNSRNFFDTLGSPVVPVNSEGGTPVFLNQERLTVRNGGAGEDPLRLLQGGFVLGGPLKRDKWFFFFSGERQHLDAKREVNFAVPTVDQRGVLNSGATGLSNNSFGPAFAFPTSFTGDAVFSFFPFPNNPTGIYGPNTFTQQLPADGRGTILSAKTDVNFNAWERRQALTIRYNFTNDERIIPVTGGALFSSLEPRVRTQNISTFLNGDLSGPNSTNPLSNQLRLSYGRTRLVFDEVRDEEFVLPIQHQFNNPEDAQFLLNVPLLSNSTLPTIGSNIDNGICRLLQGLPLNSVCFNNNGTTEDVLGFGPIGQINIAGFSPVGVDVFNFPQRRVNNTYQLADNLSWRVGNHSFVFGTDIRRTELNSDLPRNSRPLLTFNGAPRIVCANADCSDLEFARNVNAPNPFISPTDFAAAGAPSGVFQSLALPGRDSRIDLRYYQLNFFVQDEWRIRRNFSLSYGLRYEYNTPPRETSRNIERTFNDPLLDLRGPVFDQPLVAGLRDFLEGRTQIFDPDRNNFAPRIGFAYSPNLFGSERTTVIRAGYGLYYDQILGAVVSQSRNVFPTFTTINFGGGRDPVGEGFSIFNPLATTINGVPLVQPGTINTINPALPFDALLELISRFFPSNGSGGPFGATLPRRTLETPMAHHFSVTFEQQLSRDLVASAAYVGTRGRNLLRFTTPNLGPNFLVVPFFVETSNFVPNFLGFTFNPGALTPSASLSETGGRPNNTIGPVNIFDAAARSDYDALQLQLRGRFRRSFQFQVAYTFSKSNDDVSDVFDLAGASALPQNSLTFAGEYGPSNFDARHRFSYNFVYDLPLFRDHSRAFQLAFGGLQIASIGRFQTGQPFTVNSIFDVNLDGNLTDRLNSTAGIVETGDRGNPIALSPGVNPIDLLAAIGTDGSVGRNTFRAGNVLELDLAVVKNFALTDRQHLTFRMDIFNFINRANFGVPVRFLEAPGFGRATDTVTPGRRIQFALKYSF
ncbi:MAG: carboxypeptidase-like regulatory domain-containing protein [Pyrinomonadaceae bacterium]